MEQTKRQAHPEREIEAEGEAEEEIGT